MALSIPKIQVDEKEPQFICAVVDYAPDYTELKKLEGDKIYQRNCKTCHQLHKKVIGPSLGRVAERRDSIWLINWMTNSETMISAGDSLSIALYNEYNQVKCMTLEADLSNQDINNLYLFLNEASKVRFY